MTPTEIREIVGQTHFLVVCDECHGRMFEAGVLCPKCDGEGRVLVAERRKLTHMSKPALKSALVVMVAICLVIVSAFLILR